jgi:adenylate kinase family enzyme
MAALGSKMQSNGDNMEIAKFVLTAVGTFVSVSGLMFAVFQFWVKKREEKDAAFKASVKKDMEVERLLSRDEIQQERNERKESIERLAKRLEALERNIMDNLQQRMGNIEGELKALRGTLRTIEQWFIANTPAGGK